MKKNKLSKPKPKKNQVIETLSNESVEVYKPKHQIFDELFKKNEMYIHIPSYIKSLSEDRAKTHTSEYLSSLFMKAYSLGFTEGSNKRILNYGVSLDQSEVSDDYMRKSVPIATYLMVDFRNEVINIELSSTIVFMAYFSEFKSETDFANVSIVNNGMSIKMGDRVVDLNKLKNFHVALSPMTIVSMKDQLVSMEKNKDKIILKIGKEKFDELVDMLKKRL